MKETSKDWRLSKHFGPQGLPNAMVNATRLRRGFLFSVERPVLAKPDNRFGSISVVVYESQELCS